LGSERTLLEKKKKSAREVVSVKRVELVKKKMSETRGKSGRTCP